MSVAVIIPSFGRPNLGETVSSVFHQLDPEDQIIVEMDWPLSGHFGNYARERGALRAKTTHLWFLDDDDVALPKALDAMRAAIAEDPNCAWFFKVRTGFGEVWKEGERLRSDGQSGQCYLIPNVEKRPLWTTRDYLTDYALAELLMDRFGFKWNEAVVADLGVGAAR